MSEFSHFGVKGEEQRPEIDQIIHGGGLRKQFFPTILRKALEFVIYLDWDGHEIFFR